MKVSVPPGLGCSPAGAGVCEPPPVAFGEHAASASAKVIKSAATRRYVTTRTTPSARTLAHALPTDDLFVEFNELRCDVGPVVLGSPPRPRFAEALPQAGIADQPLEGVGEGLGALWLDEEAGDISLYDTLLPVDFARDDREPGRHRIQQDAAEGFLPRGGGTEKLRRLAGTGLGHRVDRPRLTAVRH